MSNSFLLYKSIYALFISRSFLVESYFYIGLVSILKIFYVLFYCNFVVITQYFFPNSTLQSNIALYFQNSTIDEEGLACRTVSIYLMIARAYLPDIQKVSEELLKSIYRYCYEFRKVMITLLELGIDKTAQLNLFEPDDAETKKSTMRISNQFPYSHILTSSSFAQKFFAIIRCS